MANIQPQTELILCKDVRLDRGYKHAYYLGQQISTRNNGELFVQYHLLQSNHLVANYTDYTYQREGRDVIRVKGRIDDLWAVNYLAYKNPIIGTAKPNKWYFGFVDEVVYVNNETVDIYFTPDILTTWWDEAHLKECFVERMHEPNDTYGKNLIAEPISFGDYKHALRSFTNRTLKTTLIDLTDTYTLVPVVKGHDWTFEISNETNMGYDRVISGYKVYCYDTDNIFDDVTSADYNSFCNLMNNIWTTLESGENILGLFVIPKDLIKSTDIKTVIDARYGNQPVLDITERSSTFIPKAGYTLDGYTSLDGYLPANVKMYTAPFCVCEILAPNGNSEILRHEYMRSITNVGGVFDFEVDANVRILRNVFPPVSILIRPEKGYGTSGADNDDYNSNIQLEFSDLPLGSWTWGVFQQWVVQKLIPAVIDVGLLAASFTGAMNVATDTNNTTATIRTRYNKKGDVVGTSAETKQKTGHTESNSGRVFGIKQSANFAKEAYSWLQQPPISHGKNNSNGAFSCGEAVIDVRCVCPNAQDAERIDRFLTAYGYAQDRVMQPMRCVREHFTYVQTNDCIVVGDLPSEICYELAKIYDNGITFWCDLDGIGGYDFTRGGNDCLSTPLI